MRVFTEEYRIKDRARSKAYYWAQKKKRANDPELQEDYRRRNRRKYIEKLKRDKDAVYEYNRKYYQEHKEYFKQYYAKKRRQKYEDVSETVS